MAVLVVAIVASELGKLVAGETKVDILVTPFVTIVAGCGLAMLCAPAIGVGASWVGNAIMAATELQPLLMGMAVSALVGIALTLPISSAAICAALSLTGLAGGAAWCPRGWAPRCSRWATSCATPASGFRRSWRRSLPAPSPPACSTCR